MSSIPKASPIASPPLASTVALFVGKPTLLFHSKERAIRTFKLINRVWQYALFVRIGGTQDQAKKWFVKKFNADPTLQSGPEGTVFYLRDTSTHVMWFSGPPSPALCAHEAFHSVLHVLTFKGLGPPSDTTDEAYAYLIQWTVENILSRSK